MSTLLTEPRIAHHDANGKPFPGALCATYISQTNTPAVVWQNGALTIPHTNPVVSDDLGRFPPMYGSPGVVYKFLLTDRDGGNPRMIDPASPFVLTQAEIGAVFYPQTDSENNATLTPASTIYPPGDLRRWGCDVSGATNNATQIADAIRAAIASGGPGCIYHPGGTIRFDSTIIVPNGITIYGDDRAACIFNYVGTHQAFVNTNGPNSSGYGKVNFNRIKITTSSLSNTGAAIELNAGGFAFYEISECWISGSFKWGIILDGAEVTHIRNNIIENSGPPLCANIWIVNGPDRSVGQGTGFTNNIHVIGNQLNTTGVGSVNIVDDGGSNHWHVNNNINGGRTMITMANVLELVIDGNEMENAGNIGTALGNVYFTDLTHYTAVNVGPCRGGVISGNFFGADYSSTSTLVFDGTAMHQGINIHGNYFRFNLGRNADIDVTKLSNSYCGENYAAVSVASGQHYGGVHNDADGNELRPPQNGYAGGFTEAAYVHGDTRFPHQFFGNFALKKAKFQSFVVEIINVGGTLQHSICNQGTLLGAAAWGDRINGATAVRTNTPTVNSGTGFTAGGGITTNVFVLNTADQIQSEGALHAVIEYYDGNAQRVRVTCGNNIRNVNTATQNRPELVFTDDMTGAAATINTTLLPANKSIRVAVMGFLI
jgi:hypothetical protein